MPSWCRARKLRTSRPQDGRDLLSPASLILWPLCPGYSLLRPAVWRCAWREDHLSFIYYLILLS